jgi:hypothetical protein
MLLLTVTSFIIHSAMRIIGMGFHGNSASRMVVYKLTPAFWKAASLPLTEGQTRRTQTPGQFVTRLSESCTYFRQLNDAAIDSSELIRAIWYFHVAIQHFLALNQVGCFARHLWIFLPGSTSAQVTQPQCSSFLFLV